MLKNQVSHKKFIKHASKDSTVLTPNWNTFPCFQLRIYRIQFHVVEVLLEKNSYVAAGGFQ